jgi:hypothetical protein
VKLRQKANEFEKMKTREGGSLPPSCKKWACSMKTIHVDERSDYVLISSRSSGFFQEMFTGCKNLPSALVSRDHCFKILSTLLITQKSQTRKTLASETFLLPSKDNQTTTPNHRCSFCALFLCDEQKALTRG